MTYKSVILSFFTIPLLTLAVLARQRIGNSVEDYHFKSIGIREGLSQSTVLSIYQDHYGYIWLGTRNGLNRYDGHSVKIFRNEIDKASSLKGNVINKIQEDADHNLWLATNEGLNFFDRKTETFTHYVIPQNDQQEILDLQYDQKGIVWVACAKGLFAFQPTSGQFYPASTYYRALQQVEKQYVSALSIQGDTLLAGTNTNGLYQFARSSGKMRHIPLKSVDGKEQAKTRINAIYKDERGRIWVGTNGNGLLCYRADGTSDLFSESPDIGERSITNNNVRSITTDAEGNTWVGTFDGLNIIPPKGTVHQIRYRSDDPKGLSHGSVRSLLTDRDGSIWVGTYFGGVNIYNEKLQEFRHFQHISGNERSLSYNVVGAFAETASGKLIVGTERGGINIFDGDLQKVNPTNRHQAQLTIKSLYKTRDNTIWAGVFRHGLQKVDTLTGLLVPVKRSSTGDLTATAIINAMAEDERGRLWLATDEDGGVHQFDPGKGQLTHFTNDSLLHAHIASSSVKHIYLGKDQTLYIATRDKGLISYATHTGKVQRYPQIERLARNLNAVFEDSLGGIWLATNGNGVIHLSAGKDRIRHYHTGNGLLNNIVYSIAEDEAGNTWFSTLTGLSRYDKATERFTNFAATAGFPLLELNEGSIFRSGNQQLLVGGNNGFVVFDPMKMQAAEKQSPLLITSLHILGQGPQSIHLLGGQEVMARPITLNYKQPVFTIDYVSINYLEPEHIRYAYRLAGLDSNWYPLRNDRSVTFSSLPAGSYTFQVRSSDDGITWHTSSQQVAIRVLPAPWLSWWAIASYGLAAIGILIAIRRNEIRKRDLEHTLLIEKVEKQKWKDVHDLKLKYFTDVSHEFRTPLTLIAGPVEDLVNDAGTPPKLLSKLQTVYHNSKRLMLLIDQVLDINRLDEGKISLHTSSVCLHELLRTVADNFGQLAEKKQIDFQFEAKENHGFFMADVDKVEKILYNLLSNAFKFTPADGAVTLRYETTAEGDLTWFHIQVADTGKGLQEEERGQIFDRFYKADKHDRGAGIGLSLVKSMVDLMDGNISVASAPAKGSVFQLSLPFESAHVQAHRPRTIFLKELPTAYEPEEAGEVAPDTKENEQPGKTGHDELILVVEDEAEIARYIGEQLRQDGFRVTVASNGLKAWEKAQKQVPDLVITDLRMPAMNGMELCERLKTNEVTSHIPVIILTAKTDDASKIKGLETGADDYIAKPFHTRELKTRVNNLLANRKRLQEKFQSMLESPVAAKLSIGKYDQELLAKITDIVERHLADPALGVEFIGDKIGMSREHLFRKLKAITGYSPSDFVRNQRLHRAAKLLKGEQLKVAEVAYQVGYQDVPYFSKSFKKKFGCSPQQYVHQQEPLDG